MSINISTLATDMTVAFKKEFSIKWSDTKEFAEAESQKLAQSLSMIEALIVSRSINQEQARLLLNIQRNATLMVLLTIEGLGLLAVEHAINAALGVVKSAVNTALGFELI